MNGVRAVLSGGLLLGSPAAVQDAPPERAALHSAAELGAVEMQVRFTPGQLSLAEAALLEVEVTAPAGVELAPLDFGERWGDFRVREGRGEPPVEQDGLRRWRATALLEPTRAGEVEIPPVVVGFRLAPGEAAQRLESAGMRATITSSLGAEPAGLGQLRGAGQPAAAPRSRWRIWPAGAALAALLAAWAALRRRRSRSRPAAPPLSPRERALRALEALLRDSAATTEAKSYYLQLTAIVRGFIEDSTRVRAPELTTEEFLRAIQSHPSFREQDRRELQVFLEAADLVKFAAAQPASRALQASAGQARTFLETFFLEAAA